MDDQSSVKDSDLDSELDFQVLASPEKRTDRKGKMGAQPV